MPRAYLVVEGRGEIRAAANLVHRVNADLDVPRMIWADPIRGTNLYTENGIRKACELVRSKPNAMGLLILRDSEGRCPSVEAPDLVRILAELRLPFPAAIVLMYQEYEVLFLASLRQLAGRDLTDDRNVRRPGIVAGADFLGGPESVRGVKEKLSEYFVRGRSYKPSLDQLPLTQMLDLNHLRQRKVPSFGSLERAIRFLATQTTGVYPRPRADSP